MRSHGDDAPPATPSGRQRWAASSAARSAPLHPGADPPWTRLSRVSSGPRGRALSRATGESREPSAWWARQENGLSYLRRHRWGEKSRGATTRGLGDGSRRHEQYGGWRSGLLLPSRRRRLLQRRDQRILSAVLFALRILSAADHRYPRQSRRRSSD